jgi:hypothetical protein
LERLRLSTLKPHEHGGLRGSGCQSISSLWLGHKQKYLLLTTFISGHKQVGIDIDDFLEPLMEDMQKLWEHGVNEWDEYKNNTSI